MLLFISGIHGLPSILNICKVSSFCSSLSSPSHPYNRILPYIAKFPMPITRLALWI